MDDSTFPAVLAELHQHLIGLADWLRETPELDLATAEITTLARVRDIGGRLLEAGLAARGAGDRPDGGSCACGHRLRCEGTRPKEIQTLLGWITVRRRSYRCATCKVSQVPLDQHLGLHRDSHRAGVRRLASRCGALLPFAQAASTLREAAGIQRSASTVRTVTEGLGAEREDAIVSEVAAAWEAGWGPVPGDVPARWYVAMDGVRILSTDGQGREAKLGMVVPVHQTAGGERRDHARSTASFEAAEAFGRRLAMLAHDQQVDLTDRVAVLGDGAAWIWNLAEEHLPGAVHIGDWYHARERVWELGRALDGPETAATATWVERQLNRLAAGEAATLAAAWHDLPCRGEAAQVREAQVTSVTNQASRMADDQYRAAGWDIGSGMIESACKAVIGQREKGAGMRWSEPGAQAVTNVRLLLFNDAWSDYWTTAA